MLKKIITKFIITVGKIFIRESADPSEKIITQYNKEKPLITKLYSKPLYWHGSGRYHHSDNVKSDVLKGIIDDNGLQPLVKDPWLKVNGGYKYTISLSNIRTYASVYALIHQQENTDIYLYGNRFIWSMLVGFINFIQEPFDIIYHALLFTFKGGKGKIKGFQSKVRKNENLQDLKTFVFQLMYMPSIRSDIKDNYPILIAIKSDNVKETKMDSGFDYYEVRTEEAIPFNEISHIEVPLDKVSETKRILHENGINLKIISIESAELFIKENSSIDEQLIPTPRKLFSKTLSEQVKLPYNLKIFEQFISNFFENTRFHKYPHALRCYLYSCIIGSQNPDIDIKVVSLASFFHDIQKTSIFDRNHGEKSSKWVSDNLNNHEFNISKKQKEQIVELCRLHNREDSKNISSELQIVKDSDSLDRWRLPLCKTKKKYLRTKTAKEINEIVKDFVEKYNSINQDLKDNESLILCSKYFGIDIQ